MSVPAMKLQSGSKVEFQLREAIRIEHLRAYSEASGDPNRIHLDESVAKQMGLPGIIAHGMLIMAYVSERALGFMNHEAGEGKGWSVQSFQTRFKAMTLLGEQIQVGGTVKEVGSDQVTLDLEARNSAGELKTTSVVKLGRV